MGLKAVANPAAGGQPGSFTTLTVSGNATVGGTLVVTDAITGSGVTSFGTVRAQNVAQGVIAVNKIGENGLQLFSNGTGNGGIYLDNPGVTVMGFSGNGVAVTGSISATAGVEGADFRAYTADNAAGGAGVNTASVAFANGGTVKARIRSAVYGDGYMAFHVNDDTERMRLTSTGLAVTGFIATTANSASPAIDITQNGAGFSLRTNSPAQINGYLDVQGAIYASADAYVTGSISATGYIAGAEQTPPSAPAANGYRIFAQDNGAGKTQLMVIFASGAAQQIAIEP